ncbi:UDP-glucose 4-epimerase GalE [[Mycoplasma] collis]|uniref:UDP-glucose 4-epimerase GalE n=1 Tax=[Mycoplasma] collis TaxID=2127 RepID=UPI00051BDE34|nr:UDP-glucose 4-epimerase GalE [[Mycoplasma] collis]
MNKETFLLIGGAGYIGSNFAWLLSDLKQNIIIVDNLSTGNKEFLPPEAKFYETDHNNFQQLEKIFSENKIDVIVQLAAFIKVGESVLKPLDYYQNNINGIINILKLIDKYKIKKLIFSSTAAVYGQNPNQNFSEDDFLNPINPYGQSKLFCEKIIIDYAVNNPNFKYGILRYFNVAGADPDLRSGLFSKTNNYSLLIPVISNSILENKEIKIFGNDYQTKDKTCIRDYIHVSDLARAHYLLNNYLNNNKSDIFNVGLNKGISNLEIIKTFEKIIGKKIDFTFSPRREGDPDKLIANNEKIKNILGFKNKYNLKDIIGHEWKWRNKIKEK